MPRRRKHWGWGFEDQQPPHEQVEALAAGAREHLGFPPAEVERPARLEDLELPPPRLEPPASIATICRSDPYERAAHAYGKSYRDVVRAFRGRFDNPPDLVAHPTGEAELERVLAWCEQVGAAAIPYGGGTSVVGGVEPPADRPAVSIDLGAMDRVLDVDRSSRAARIQAGATGPVLEEQLRDHGLTLRHFPQSFEYSTLGGWIATRAGGHFATLYTHIDDFVESVRALTPRGLWESRRLPGSGAGPSPDRLLIGSEGILGVMTEAWMRVQDAPRFKDSAGVLFDSFESGAQAVRDLSQSGLHPSNCRLLDAGESGLTGAAPEGKALLVLAFESADHELGAWMSRALELCRDHGGHPRERRGESEGAWRNAFLQAPYLRDTLVAAGVFAETFETAITWDRFEEFVAGVREVTREAVDGDGIVTCRLTHVYPDGAAPYFTVLAPARRGDELAQWEDVKSAASETIIAAGGTITHHHAVGRDHRRWYDRQRPEPFAEALRAAKAAVVPAGILNPGVLIDP
ncbi:MAG TPA: FAD-binding oxidoreductase [Thermoleophilaceae bacterium]|nr:FAD-binding oxidoreductase [Thermoleophilaceae bacterium]